MQSSQTRRRIRQVLVVTFVLNFVVASGKIILGFATGALAITADGFHSLTDAAGNIAGLIGNTLANRPPDDDHPYGHRRFETMAALLIAALLLLSAWEMIQGVVERWQAGQFAKITPLTFIVLFCTLLINIVVSRYQIREGQRLKSEILLADAKNTGADVLVTAAVMVSTGIYAVTGWLWVDGLAALVVIGLIGKAAWEIMQDTGRILVDTAPYAPQQLTTLLSDMPQTFKIVRARSRGPLDAVHIDMDIQVPPAMTTEQSNHIASTIRQRLQAQLQGITEIEVHFAPARPQGRDAALTARAYADARGLAAHEVQMSQDAQGAVLEMHVEVPPGQTLAQAHRQVTLLEIEMVEALPHIDRVVTHIEPLMPQDATRQDTSCTVQAEQIYARADLWLQAQYPQVAWHDLCVRPLQHGFAMNLHAALPANTSVEAAHEIAEAAEVFLRHHIPELMRVTIHTEPLQEISEHV